MAEDAEESDAEIAVLTQTLDDMNKFILENAAEPTTTNMDNMSEEEIEQLKALGYLGEDAEEGDEVELPF